MTNYHREPVGQSIHDDVVTTRRDDKSEELQLRAKVAELEKRAAFCQSQWESAMRVIYTKNPLDDEDWDCIPPSEMARRHIEAMMLAWEYSAGIKPLRQDKQLGE